MDDDILGDDEEETIDVESVLLVLWKEKDVLGELEIMIDVLEL